MTRTKQMASKTPHPHIAPQVPNNPGHRRRYTTASQASSASSAPSSSSSRANTPGGAKKRKKLPGRRGTGVLAQINELQKSGRLVIPRDPFRRVINEMTGNLRGPGEFKYRREAMDALQEATEIYLASLMEDAYQATLHAKRVTLFPTDIRLALRLRGNNIF